VDYPLWISSENSQGLNFEAARPLGVGVGISICTHDDYAYLEPWRRPCLAATTSLERLILWLDHERKTHVALNVLGGGLPLRSVLPADKASNTRNSIMVAQTMHCGGRDQRLLNRET
jgi:hypothetical protein